MTEIQAKHSKHVDETGVGPLSWLGLRSTAFPERWLPGAFGLVLVLTFVVLLFGFATGEPLLRRAADPDATAGLGLVDAWGKGFWGLTTFTLQTVMSVIGVYAVATTRPVAGLIARLGRVPSTPRGAMVFVAVAALATSYLSWALSLVFAAMLAREVARNVPAADYRALGAMALLGFRDADRPSALVPFSGGYDGSGFSWQGLVAKLLVCGVAVGTAWLIAPGRPEARSAADLGVELAPLVGRRSQHNEDTRSLPRMLRPGDWLEYSPVPGLLVGVLGILYPARHGGGPLRLDTLNLALFTLALLLHWRPWRMARAVREGATMASGMLLLFPLYGGIAGMVAYTGVAERLAGWLLSVGGGAGFPPVVAGFSFLLAVVVPGGGSLWSPYVLDAADRFGADPTWAVVAHDLGAFGANLVQPFWMLPALALLGLKARDVIGYTFAIFVPCFLAALVAVTLLAPHVRG